MKCDGLLCVARRAATTTKHSIIPRHHLRLKSTGSPEQGAKEVSPRAGDIGRNIEDDFAAIRENYQTPRNPIVLAHGLLGFDELRLAGPWLPGLHYWRGIKEALQANGIEVISASVGPTSSVEERGDALGRWIRDNAGGKSVNIVA